MEEPAPPDGFLAKANEYRDAADDPPSAAGCLRREAASGDVEHPLEGDAGPFGVVARRRRSDSRSRPRRGARAPRRGAGASMRNIVEQGQISGSSENTVLSGCSAASRCTMWISVPTASTAPAGAAATHSWMRSVEPTRSASSTTSCAHSGCTITSTPGCSARRGRHVLGTEALVHRAVALPQQQRRVLDLALLEPAAARGAGSRRACRPRCSPS